MLYLIIILGLIGLGLMIYRRSWLGPILIISLPFERLPSTELGGITFRVSMILFLGAAIILGVDLIKKRRWPDMQTSDLLLVIFIIIGIFSAGGGQMLAFVGPHNVARSYQVLGFTIYAFLAFMITRSWVKQQGGERLIKPLLMTSGLVALFGLYQFLGDSLGLATHWTGLRAEVGNNYTKAILGYPRIQAASLEPLYLANFLLIPLGILVAAIISGWKGIKKYWQHILFVILGVVFVLTDSRSAYLGLLVSVILIICLFWRQINWSKLGLLVIDGALIVFLSFGMLLIPNGTTSLKQFIKHSTTGSDFSGVDRANTRAIAIEAWKTSPLIGIGLGDFGTYMMKNQGGDERQIVNNETFELMAETGLLGLLVILGFLGIQIWQAVKGWVMDRQKLWWLGAQIGIFLGILVHWQFFSTLYTIPIWVLLGWMAGNKKINN